jgi:hypothetical protein
MPILGRAQTVGIAAALVLAGRVPTAGAEAPGEKGPVFIVDREAATSDAAGHYALAIGVQTFADPGWPPLRFAERDAQELAKELADGGGFATTVLTGDGTTRAEVLVALSELDRTSRAASDTVVVYISTHGTLARDTRGGLQQVLALSDTSKEQALSTGLRLDELIQRFDNLKSRRKVLILATCYSGAGKSSLADSVRSYLVGMKSSAVRPLYEVSSASVILSASAWGETAREDESLGHDVYTHFFIEALRGLDADGDGATSVSEAHDFARQKTYSFSGGVQRPTAILTIEGEDPIILAGKRTGSGKPVLLAYEEQLDGFRVRVDGADKGVLPGGIVVEPGWHELVLEGPDATQAVRERIHVRDGDRLSLARLFAAEPTRQVELRGGATLIPGVAGGPRVSAIGGAVLAFRLEAWPLAFADVAVEAGGGLGRETWTINRERISVGLREAAARLGILRHWEFGRLKLHAGLYAGTVFVERSPRSAFYTSPRRSLSGSAGLAAELRLRVARGWGLGVVASGDYLIGGLQGFSAQGQGCASWSF